MKDPTLGEMRDLLASTCPDFDEFDREAAIYWFASDWHGGQWSNMYAAMCSGPYRPGCLESKCPASASEPYAVLEQEYCIK